MKIAFVIPCLNEELTVAAVVTSCRSAIPGARVYVFDNNSTDQTAGRARAAGAEVIASPDPGKGHVIRHAFATIDADYLVMLDGDGTYPAHEAKRLVDLAVSGGYEMVNGARLQRAPLSAFRPLHFLGNHGLTWLVRAAFGGTVSDLLTGFRVFSRAFVEGVVLQAAGFEIETELTLRALAERRPVAEIAIDYAERVEGSSSKLRTIRDGVKILKMIVGLIIEYRIRGSRPRTAGAPAQDDHSRAS